MLRSLYYMLTLCALPASMAAQPRTLSRDMEQAVTTALRSARHDLIGPRKHVSVDTWVNEIKQEWSASQADAFRKALVANDSARAGVEVCDSRKRSCQLDDASEVVQIFAPQTRGDTITVMIYRQKWQMQSSPRVRWSLQGNQYVLVRRGAHWLVVRSDHLIVT